MIAQLTLHESLKLLEEGKLTSLSICEQLLNQISKVESKVNALVSIDKETVIKQAKEADLRRQQGKLKSRYDGLPITLKDNIVHKNYEARCSSDILNGLKHLYNATVTQKLLDAGCIIFGRANMDEFAMGSTTETSQVKKTHNPHNLNCVPGGSSGGSAAGVASGEFLAALGSDTGGSIRQPASFCGVVGLKPTYGLVSRFGLIAFGSSLDQIGPITKDVKDCAIIMDLIAGHDIQDSTSIPDINIDFLDALKDSDIKGLKIGMPKEYFAGNLATDVKKKINEAVETLKKLDAEIISISLPHTKYAIPTYYVLATAEASTNLARFDGIRYGKRIQDNDVLEVYKKSRSQGFGSEVKRRIMLGTYVLSSYEEHKYYHRAQKVRTLIRQDFEKAFEKCDLLVSPVCPHTAFEFGKGSKDPVELYYEDILTTAINLAGICAISVPCGYDDKKMPIGLQLIAPPLAEKRLLKVAYAYEQRAQVKRKVLEI